jgi:hypothetical protein
MSAKHFQENLIAKAEFLDQDIYKTILRAGIIFKSINSRKHYFGLKLIDLYKSGATKLKNATLKSMIKINYFGQNRLFG